MVPRQHRQIRAVGVEHAVGVIRREVVKAQDAPILDISKIIGIVRINVI